MQVAGVTVPCPRCVESPRVGRAIAAEPDQPAPVDRRQAAEPEDLNRWAAALLFLSGGACGLVFGVLVVGIFRMFGP